MRTIISFFLLLLFSAYCCHGQKKESLRLDSLIKLESSILYKSYEDNFELNPRISEIFAKAYLKKAKIDNIDYKQAYGYSMHASLYPNNFEIKIKYLDSAINITQNTENKYFPTIAYIMKGGAYEEKGLFNETLNNYLKALNFANEKNDLEYKHIINHNIALLKLKLGKYQEAKALLKDCLRHEEQNILDSRNDSISYLHSMSELVTAYRRNKELDSAVFLNKKGLNMSENLPNKCLFIYNLGILQYQQKKYKKAINNLDQALKKFLDPDNLYHKNNVYPIEIYFYLGASYDKLNKQKQAVFYYKKIDSLVQETKYLIPEIRPAYQAIINYYKSIDDKNKQLYYIDRLLYNDSILDVNFKNLNDKIIKDFDTPILLAQKEELITLLKNKNRQSNDIIILAILAGIIISSFLVYYYRKQKLFKIRFEELMKSSEKIKVTSNENNELASNTEASLDISGDVINKILVGLENFEETYGFTQVNLTSSTLAKELKTNPKYLTKVVKHYRQKNFSPYINDLRIDFIVNKLKTDQKLQNYTIKAIATEAGFNSSEVFSKYFYKKTGIYPSYFVKELQNNISS